MQYLLARGTPIRAVTRRRVFPEIWKINLNFSSFSGCHYRAKIDPKKMTVVVFVLPLHDNKGRKLFRVSIGP